MNNIIKRKWNQNSMVIIEDLQGMAFQAESGGHTFQISGIDGEGNTVALSGTPAGVMLRSDGQDVTLTCSVSGGVVSATLPANAYSVPGRFGLTIFLTSDGQKTAIYAAVGTVGKTSSGTVAPPAGSDVVDLVNAIATAVATIPASYTDLMASVAPTYSSAGLYAVGSYAWYNGKLYRCTTAITSGETWTSGHWTLANLGSDLVDLKIAFEAVDNGVLVPVSTTLTSWEQGRYSSSSGVKTNADNGCRIGSLLYGGNISYMGIAKITVATGYELLILEYTTNSTSTFDNVIKAAYDNGGIGTFDILFDTGKYYSFSIRKNDRSDFTPSGLPASPVIITVLEPDQTLAIQHKCADAKAVGDALSDISDDIDDINDRINDIEEDIYIITDLGITSADWERGFISSSKGTNTNSGASVPISIRTANKKALLKDDKVFYGTDYILQVYQYDTEGHDGYVTYTKAFSDTANPYIIPANGNYRFVMRKSTEAEILDGEISTIASTFSAKRYEAVKDAAENAQVKASIQPLITPDMFYKIAIIGDSFAAGISEESGTNYTYSWLSMMSRKYGCICEHYAEGGLTTRTWLTSTYGKTKLDADENLYNLYFIALGINDSNPDSRNVPVGEITDMDVTEDYPDTFYGNMGEIIRTVMAKNANAFICFITPMRIGSRYTPYQNAVVAMREKLGCLLVDSRDFEFLSTLWWSSNLKSLHPVAPLYDALANAVADKLSEDIYSHVSYLANFPFAAD